MQHRDGMPQHEKGQCRTLEIINSSYAQTGTIKVRKLDLFSLQSVRDFANQFSEQSESLDFLILNAGIMTIPEFTTSADGYELQFAVNFGDISI